jgi:hypothetical protein
VQADEIDSIDIEDWRLERFRPTAGQTGASLALIAGGLGATLLIARIGGNEGEG